LINEVNLKNKVITELQTIANDRYLWYSQKIYKEIDYYIAENTDELKIVLNNIYSQYIKLQDTGKVGILKWIYLSFLHTSFLDHSPCFKIDFYDTRDCISEIECTGLWEFKYIFDCYYNIENEIIERLNKQTRVLRHEINDMLIQLQQKFLYLADAWIITIIKNILKEDDVFILNESIVKFMLGEYLDNSELIVVYGDEKE
jgi:hypothetical protein